MNLTKNCEFCGLLNAFESYDGKLILKFSVVKLVETPLKQSLQESLQEMLGEKICMINSDGKYYVRKISK